MKQHGYITTTNKYHYVMLTEKHRLSIYMVAAFLRKIAETQTIDDKKLTAALSDRAAIGEMRKQIKPCTLEICGDHYHIEIGNPEKPNAILNIPLSEKCVVTFEEQKPQPIITEIYKKNP